MNKYINASGFYIILVLYLFLFFGSIYGLFVDELSIFDYTLTGWGKNTLCLFILLIPGLITAYYVGLAVYRALSTSQK
jgi:hypothetical protein